MDKPSEKTPPGSPSQQEQQDAEAQNDAPVLADELLKDGKAAAASFNRLALTNTSTIPGLLAEYLQSQHQNTLDDSCTRFVHEVLCPMVETVFNAPFPKDWPYLKELHSLFPMISAVLIPLIPSGHPDIIQAITSFLNHPSGVYITNAASRSEPFNREGEIYCQWTRAGESYGYLIDAANTFGQQGGFAALLALAKNPSTPLSTLFNVCAITSGMGFLPVNTLAETYLIPIFEELERRVKSASMADLQKELAVVLKKSPTSQYKNCLILHQIYIPTHEILKRYADLDFIVILACLESKAFNMKMYGLETLKTMFNDVVQQHNPLSSELVASWVVENNLIQLFFKHNLHQKSYVSRVQDVLSSVARAGFISQDHIDLIWKAQADQHAAVVKNIHTCLATIAFWLSEELLDRLFTLVKQSWGESEKNNQELLNLLQRAAENDEAGTMASGVMNLVWDLSHDKDTSPSMQEAATNCLIKILEGRVHEGAKEREEYLLRCLEDLQQMRWAVPCLMTIVKLLRLYSAVDRKRKRSPREIVMANLSKQGMGKAVLELMEFYYGIVREQAAALNLTENQMASHIFFENDTHARTMQQFRTYLSFSVKERTYYVETDELLSLWEILVEKAPTEKDRSLAFDWFLPTFEDPPDYTEDGLVQLMKVKILQMDPASMPVKVAQCAVEIFKTVNISSKCLLVTDAGFFVKSIDGLLFLDELWTIAIDNADDQAANKVIATLIAMYTSTSQRTTSFQHQFTIMSKCIASVDEALKDDQLDDALKTRRGERNLRILRRYIMHYDTNFAFFRRYPHLLCSYQGIPIKVTFVPVASMKLKSVVSTEFNTMSQLMELRHFVLKEYNLNAMSFDISYGTTTFSPADNFRPLCVLGMANHNCKVTVKYSTNPLSGALPTKATNLKAEECLPSLLLMRSNKLSSLLREFLKCGYPSVVREAETIYLNAPYDQMIHQYMCDLLSEDASAAITTCLLEEESLFARCYYLFNFCRFMRAAATPPPFQARKSDILDNYNDDEQLDATGTVGDVGSHAAARADGKEEEGRTRSGQAQDASRADEGDHDGPGDAGFDADAARHTLFENFDYNLLLSLMDDLVKPLLGDTLATSFDFEYHVLAARACVLLLFDMVTELIKSHGDAPEAAGTDLASRLDLDHVLATFDTFLISCCSKGGFGSKTRYATRKLTNGLMMDLLAFLDKAVPISDVLRHRFVHLINQTRLEALIVHNTFMPARNRFVAMLQALVGQSDDGHAVLLDSCFQLLCSDEDDSFPCGSVPFFKLFKTLVDHLETQDDERVLALLTKQAAWLRSFMNCPPDSPDALSNVQAELSGRLRVCCALVPKVTDFHGALGGPDFPDFLLAKLLFPNGIKLSHLPAVLPGDLATTPELCSCENVREYAYKLLLVILDADVELFAHIHALITATHFRDELKIKDLCFSPVTEQREATSFVGLKNACSTCYMNSVLQQVFMQPDARRLLCGAVQQPLTKEAWLAQKALAAREGDGVSESANSSTSTTATATSTSATDKTALVAADGPSTPAQGTTSSPEDDDPENPENSLLAQFIAMLGNLTYSERKAFAPKGIWKTYRHWGAPVNVREQQDACEFFNCLIDQIDESLHKLHKPKLLSQIFGGMFVDQKIVREGCSHRYARDEPFTNISVNITDCKNLEESLTAYTAGEMLEGYRCERCDEKRNITKRSCFKTCPPVLAFQLKRFDFDWERGVPVKFNDYFEFPDDLDIGPFTAEGMAARETGDGDGDVPRIMYRLCGVVVHSGQANGGHYYSFARNRHPDMGKKDTWFKFDDSDVSEIDYDSTSSMAKDWFGGTTLQSVFDQKLQRNVQKRRPRWWNAYLLFYERVTDAPFEQAIPQPQSGENGGNHGSKDGGVGSGGEKGTPGANDGTAPEITRIDPTPNKALKLSVIRDSIMSLHEREVFNKEYFGFVRDVVGAVAKKGVESADADGNITQQDAIDYMTSAANLAIQFLYEYALRTDEFIRGDIADWAPTMQIFFKHLPSIRFEFANTFEKVNLASFLLYSNDSDVRELYSSLVWDCVYYTLQDSGVEDGMELMNQVLTVMREVLAASLSLFGSQSTELIELVMKYSLLGSQYRDHVLRTDWLALLVQICSGPNDIAKPIPHMEKAALRVVGVFMASFDLTLIRMTPEHLRQREDGQGDGQQAITTSIPPDTPLLVDADVSVHGENTLLPVDAFVKDIMPFRRNLLANLMNYVPEFYLCPTIISHLSYMCPDLATEVIHALVHSIDTYHFYQSAPYYNLLRVAMAVDDGHHLIRIQAALLDVQGRVGLFRVMNFCRDRFDKKAYQGVKFLLYCSDINPHYKQYLHSAPVFENWSWCFGWLQNIFYTAHVSEFESNDDWREYGLERTASMANLVASLQSELSEELQPQQQHHQQQSQVEDEPAQPRNKNHGRPAQAGVDTNVARAVGGNGKRDASPSSDAVEEVRCKNKAVVRAAEGQETPANTTGIASGRDPSRVAAEGNVPTAAKTDSNHSNEAGKHPPEETGMDVSADADL